MKPDAKFEVPTWNQIYDMLLSQAEKICQSSFKPDIIVGVTRGGWFPARVLSDLLGILDLAAVRIEFYRGIAETQKEPVLTQAVSVDVKGKRVLIVDDVADSGTSLKLAQKHVLQQGAAEARTATLYSKPWSAVKPDYHEKATSLWVVFPWETKETIRKIAEKTATKTAIKNETAKLVKAGMPKLLAERLLREVLEERNC